MDKPQTTIVVCVNATHDRTSAFSLGMKIITHILNAMGEKLGLSLVRGTLEKN